MKGSHQSGFNSHNGNNNSSYTQTSQPKSSFENFQVRVKGKFLPRSRLPSHFNDFPRLVSRHTTIFNFPGFFFMKPAVRQPFVATQLELWLQRHHANNSEHSRLVKSIPELAALRVRISLLAQFCDISLDNSRLGTKVTVGRHTKAAASTTAWADRTRRWTIHLTWTRLLSRIAAWWTWWWVPSDSFKKVLPISVHRTFFSSTNRHHWKHITVSSKSSSHRHSTTHRKSSSSFRPSKPSRCSSRCNSSSTPLRFSKCSSNSYWIDTTTRFSNNCSIKTGANHRTTETTAHLTTPPSTTARRPHCTMPVAHGVESSRHARTALSHTLRKSSLVVFPGTSANRRLCRFSSRSDRSASSGRERSKMPRNRRATFTSSSSRRSRWKLCSRPAAFKTRFLGRRVASLLDQSPACARH